MRPRVKNSIYLLLLMICFILPMMKCQKTFAAADEDAEDTGALKTHVVTEWFLPILEKPVVSCVDRTASKVYLEWSEVKQADKYYIYRASKKNGTYKKIGSTAKHVYTDKTVKAEKTYYYKVYALYGDKAQIQKCSQFSAPVKVTVRDKVQKTAYVGDSITLGLSVNNIVKGKGSKVISKKGISPYTFYKGSIMDTLLDYNPDRMFIMLGMNSLVGRPANSAMDDAIQYYKKIINACLKKNPDMQIIVLPVSPTRSTARVSNVYIKKFNIKLKAMAQNCEVYYYDYTSYLKNSDGTLKKIYNGGDGLHWKASAYQEFKDRLDAFGKTLD